MEYRDIYEHPDVIVHRRELHRLKVMWRADGTMTPSVEYDQETKTVQHFWVLGAN